MVSQEMISKLMDAGLTKQQATSKTANTVCDILLDDNAYAKAIIAEANAQVLAMQGMVEELRKKWLNFNAKLQDASDTILSIKEAQDEHGTITDGKAQNALAMYAAILDMNSKTRADGVESVKAASYVVYAYLGGQARRDINMTWSDDTQPSDSGWQPLEPKRKTLRRL